eukprot:jgi/Bigna1/58003/fgenesh1_pm.45_\
MLLALVCLSTLTYAAPMRSVPGIALAKGGEFGALEGGVPALVHPVMMGGLYMTTLYTGFLGWQIRKMRTLAAFATVDAELQNLTTERKNLVKGDFRDRHFQLSSLLLALGVGFAIEGPVNTWMRTGKLFPGPHLFAGAGLTVLWAAAAGLVPAMQKGNKFAKDMHIALNAAGLGLFSWQILSGIPILKKVLEFKFGIKL